MASVAGRHGHRGGRGETPEALAKVPVDADEGVTSRRPARSSPRRSSRPRSPSRSPRSMVTLWKTFVAEDALLVEVNPLAKASDGRGHRPRRQGVPRRERRLPPAGPRGARGQGRSQPARGCRQGQEPQLRQARRRGRHHRQRRGSRHETLDVVAYAGETHSNVKPANFLDIGGGASAEVMANGLEIILGDPDVKSVFVNVFGGITACDEVANGIVQALELLKSKGEDVTKPLVVRLDGNNAELGRKILSRRQPPARAARGHHGRRGRQGRRARGCEVRDEDTHTPWLSSSPRTARSSSRA